MKRTFLLILLTILTVALMGCGRDTSKVENAILGHWVEVGKSNSEMYFDKNKIITVFKGTKEQFKYTVVESNDKTGVIDIYRTRIGGQTVSEYRINMNFVNKDRTKFIEDDQVVKQLEDALGMKQTKPTWKYVDSKTQP